MVDLVISCLSQKGGVGKSTISRLIATAYASHGMNVCISDFNLKQKTALDWVARRDENGILPKIHGEEGTQANRLRSNSRHDVVVVDGKPDSPEITLAIARASDLVLIPTSLALDDLKAQRAFALELIERGVNPDRILIILNRHSDNAAMIEDSYSFFSGKLRVAKTSLPYRDSFIRAQNGGWSVGEANQAVLGNLAGLMALTDALSLEIATIAQELTA